MGAIPELETRSARNPRTRQPLPAAGSQGAEPAAETRADACLQEAADTAARLHGIRGAALLVATPDGRMRVAAVAGSCPLAPHETVERADDAPAEVTPLHPLPSGTMAAVRVPVTLVGMAVGVLTVFRSASDGDLPARQWESLRKIARTAAPAAAAYRIELLQRRQMQDQRIAEMGRSLAGRLDADEAAAVVAALAGELLEGHCVPLALVAGAGGDLVLHGGPGASPDPVVVRDGMLAWVTEHACSVATASVATDPRSAPSEFWPGPALAAPIRHGGSVLGALMVVRPAGERPFDREAAELLERLAASAAVILHNAAVHREQQAQAASLRLRAGELERSHDELGRGQQQLLIAEKMAALGRVTAGIAHEINSPLAGILNSLRTARAYVEEYRASIGDPDVTAEDHRGIAEDLNQALTVADRAVGKVAHFVRTIKGQTRVGDGQRSFFDPADEIEATVSLLQHELRRCGVDIHVEVEREHVLHGDQGKFGMVVQNLVSNALDAYEGKPGSIRVRGWAQQGALRLSVQDHGCGIHPDIRDRIFDYLFTTKDIGKGTGLGLAMVHSIVTSDFQGSIELESQPGVGTTFLLTLPFTPAARDHGA